MKSTITERTRRFVNACSSLELFASGDSSTSFIGLRQLCLKIKRDLFLLESAIALRQIRISHDEMKRIPGSKYEQDQYRTQYRCWSCINFGAGCINPYMNRMACHLFFPNLIIERFPSRHSLLGKSRGNRPPKLKPPEIISYSKHCSKCRVCLRYHEDGKCHIVVRTLTHYSKYRTRKRKKLAAYYAFYGVQYSEKYILEWEE